MEANTKNFYNKHFLLLSALFVLGNTVITAPQNNADEFNFLGFLISGLMSIGMIFIGYLLPFSKITAIIMVALAFFCIADAGVTFVRFIHTDLLPQTSPFLIVLPFILLLIFIALKPFNIILKFSLICFLPCLAVILLFFLSTAKDFNIRNIFIYELPKTSNLFWQTVPYIKGIVTPSFLMALVGKNLNFKKSAAFIGFGMGFILLGITVLNSVLLFGMELSARLSFPYSSVGSTVTFGNLFTRLDGFLYFVYLVSSVVKCSVGIFAIKKSREKFFP